MHPIRAALAVVAMLAVALITAVPAAAGGPTSALLAVPGEGATASLYYTDPDYDALAGLVGVESGGIGVGDPGTVDDSGRSHENGPGVTVTWLVHDVTPWRIDRIYVGGEGAPWISTQVGAETGSVWDGPVVWHQPDNAVALVALLDRLGVGAAARDAAAKGDFSGVAGAPVADSSAPVAEPEAALAESSAVAGIWWGLGGLAGGALLTLVLLRLRRGPVAEVESEPAPDADAPISEELAWGGRRG